MGKTGVISTLAGQGSDFFELGPASLPHTRSRGRNEGRLSLGHRSRGCLDVDHIRHAYHVDIISRGRR